MPVLYCAAVSFTELFGLDEHPAGAARGVVDSALVRFEQLDQHADDGARRVELATELAFGGGEFAEEVFVDAAERIFAVVVVCCNGRGPVWICGNTSPISEYSPVHTAAIQPASQMCRPSSPAKTIEVFIPVTCEISSIH